MAYISIYLIILPLVYYVLLVLLFIFIISFLLFLYYYKGYTLPTLYFPHHVCCLVVVKGLYYVHL